jgi:hypothetical protein
LLNLDEAGGFRQLQNHLQCRGLRISDRHPFDRSNFTEDLVGGYKVLDGAGAVQTQRYGELKRIERAQAMTYTVAFDQFSGVVIMSARQRNNSKEPVRDVFQKAASKTRSVAR